MMTATTSSFSGSMASGWREILSRSACAHGCSDEHALRDRFSGSLPGILAYSEPLPTGTASWSSSNFSTGAASQTLDTSWRSEVKAMPSKCWSCGGNGKCWHDDVQGSGKKNGEKEWYCSGTGKCYNCSGTGWV
jgi:hypothetical protein